MEDILTTTLKGVALMKLVESGVIAQAKDGNVDTEGFERFWSKFEPNVQTWHRNQVALQEKRSQHDEDGESYYDFYGDLLDTLRRAVLPFLLGFFGALALAFR